jgi:hypothetical protein
LVKKKTGKKNKTVKKEPWHVVPLKGSFMVFSMVGFLSAAYLISHPGWRLSFIIVFTMMFIASLISLSKAPVK